MAGVAPSATLKIKLLGGFQVVVGDRVVLDSAWRLRKPKSLLKLLALAPDHTLHREQLLDLLWSDLEPDAAAANLRHSLHVARRTLDPTGAASASWLLFQSDLVIFRSLGSIQVDVEAFEAAVAVARRSREPAAYDAAVAWYTGDLLPEDRYEDWAAGRREALRETFLAVLLELAALRETRGDRSHAIDVLRRAVSHEPAHEEAHVGLMRLYALAGQRHQALRQYQQLQESLRRELDAVPDRATQRLAADIQAGRFPAGDAAVAVPPAASAPAPPTNLPILLTSFVGRAEQVAELRRLLGDLGSGPRLVTLTGPGGCGKTRLALEVGGASLATHPDGVWLVDLAPLSDPELVPRTVATVLAIRESPDQPVVAALVEALRARSLLLILDNCEHVIEASARLADALLRGCPRIRILATSREGLGIPGELLWPVPPLALPPEGAVAVDQIGPCTAVRLFVERATSVQPRFELTPANARIIAQVCRRLDGIPLALELAAARLQALSIDQLAARLDQCFRLLTGGSRVALARQQTLAATVGWSYDLLTLPEQTLFQRLAVFAGGFTIEAAEAVCSEDVFDVLLRLVGKSLVVAGADDGGGDRYRLLETLRQYAREKLVASGEAEEIARRHAEAYLALAEQAEPELQGPNQVVWFDRLDREHNNLRAAFEWLAAQSRWPDALRLAVAISGFWIIRGFYTEGHERLAASLARVAGPSEGLLRARAYRELGYLASRQGDYSEGDRCWEVCLRLATEAGNRPLIVHALMGSAVSAVDYVSPGLAQSWLQEALVIARELSLRREVGRILVILGFLAVLREDLVGAESHFAESLAILRDAGDAVVLAYGLFLRCGAAAICGDYARLRALAEEYRSVARVVGDRGGQANSLVHLAHVAWADGDLATNQALLTQALTIYRDVADHTGVAWAAAGLSRAYLQRRDVAGARALVDEGLALVHRYGDHAQLSMIVLRAAGDVALARGEVETAASYYRKGLVLLTDHWLGSFRLSLIEGMAVVDAARHQPLRAVQLAAAAAAEWTRLGATPAPFDRDWLETALAPARESLTENAWTAAWAAGQAMTLDQAIAEALGS
jgi:predicted ATPase/DNA-binding SARP family transcriptional activator